MFFIRANLNCTSLQMFHFKNQKNTHQKIPQNLNPPYPPNLSFTCFKSLGYPAVEWHVCHDNRCIRTGINFGLSWEFQGLSCTVSPGISPLFCHGRTLFSVFTFGSLRCLMVTDSFQSPSAEKKKMSYNEWSCRILCPCWILHYSVQKLLPI